MKMFDKIKDLFTDEVEVEDEPIKKEVIQVEIPAPKSNVNTLKEDEVKPISKPSSPFFDEKDFEDIKKNDITLEDVYKEEKTYREEKPLYREERNLYREEKKEIYGVKKEEPKKRFEPTPIISPVYGVLDKNYKKDDIINKAELPKANKDMTIDDVRNKAYGTLEDELENTLFGRTAILFQTEKKEEYQEIEEDLDKTATAIDLLKDDVSIEEPPRHEKVEKEESLEDTMMNDALKGDLESDDKLSESDLFNLIDDMYGKGE